MSEVSKYLAAIGRRGGKAKGAAKTAAARANGKLGGRPTNLERLAARAGERLVKAQPLFFGAFAGSIVALVVAWFLKGIGL
jgi:hypothetical protein